jgi:hypothetical protein
MGYFIENMFKTLCCAATTQFNEGWCASDQAG